MERQPARGQRGQKDLVHGRGEGKYAPFLDHRPRRLLRALIQSKNASLDPGKDSGGRVEQIDLDNSLPKY